MSFKLCYPANHCKRFWNYRTGCCNKRDYNKHNHRWRRFKGYSSFFKFYRMLQIRTQWRRYRSYFRGYFKMEFNIIEKGNCCCCDAATNYDPGDYYKLQHTFCLPDL